MGMTAINLPCYPTPILRAIQNIHFIKEFKEFTASTREVLVAIAARLDYREPERSFWFKRDKAAQNIGLSRRTIYYALNRLEEAGFIIRDTQPVSEYGYFCCAKIRATKLLIKLLGLGLTKNSFQHPSAKNARLYPKDNLKKQPTDWNSFSKIEENKPQPSLFQKDSQLQYLLDLGLSKFAIYALMTISKNANQRLSTVVAYLGKTLNELDSPRVVFAYIRTCINSGQNYQFALSHKLKQKQIDNLHKIEQKKLSDNLTEFKQKVLGKLFVSNKTGDIYLANKTGACNQNTGGWLTIYDLFKAVESGRLISTN